MPLKDEMFGHYQDRRSKAEKEIKEIVGGWAFASAATADMTFQEVRDLTDRVVLCMNKATRDCYELGEKCDADSDA